MGGTQNLSYNAENKLVSVSGTVTANFVYDGDGKRVKSTINGSSVVYIGNDYEWTSSGVTQYYTTGSQRVGMRRSGYVSNNGLFWVLGDHLGSTSITASANGSLYSEQRYTAWGSNRYISGSLLSQRQYTGQINDGFGLYFYNARFYDPLLARFSQADTIVPGKELNYSPLTVDYSENKFLQQLNQENQERLENNLDARSPFVSINTLAFDRYAYSYNNPLIYNDPDGHNPFAAILALIGPLGLTAIGVSVVAVGIYFVVPGVREAVTNGIYQAGEEVSNGLKSLFSKGEYIPRSIQGEAERNAYREAVHNYKDAFNLGPADDVPKWI